MSAGSFVLRLFFLSYRENEFWVLCLEAFLSFLQAGILGEVPGEAFSRIFVSSPGVPFQDHGLH